MIMLLLIGIVGVCVANIVLGIFVYLNNPQKASTRYFALLCLSLSLWTVFNYLADYQLSNTLLWTRMTFFSISYAILFLLLFLNAFPNKIIKTKAFGLVTGAVAIVTSLISLLPGFIPAVEIKDSASNVVTGPLYYVYMVYILAFFIGMIYFIVVSWKKSNRDDKTRLKFLLFGIVAMAVLAALTNFVLPLIMQNNIYAKYGTFATLIFVASTAYAIVRHSLFDLRAVVARSFTYALTIVTIGILYGFLAFGLIGRYLFAQSINQITFNQQLVNTALAVLLAFTFQPLRRFFQKVTDKIFYKDKYDPQSLLNDISLILASEIEIDELAGKVCKKIVDRMHLQNARTVVLDKGKVIFESKELSKIINADEHGLLKKLGNTMLYVDQLERGDKSNLLKTLNASVSIPLKTSNQFIGYLILGQKKSGDIFNQSDLDTIKIIAGEFSIGLENAIAFSEIQMFNKTLQQKIQIATASLRSANEQLKQLDTAKDEFISLAGHQLRTPLTTVKGYVSMLSDGDFGNLTKEQKSSIDLALDGSNRMARLIDDLLNVSRMEAGKFFIDSKMVDLTKVVPEEIELLKTLAESKNVRIKYTAPKSSIPKIMLDDDKTRQVIMNITENAIQYSPAKGGLVEVSLQKDKNKVVFKVKDNGIGVPKDQQAKLFTKMFRASNAKETRPDGTGLGLFLVKRVVEDQGGQVIFESKPGHGSTFGFIIPIHNHISVDKKARAKLLEGSEVSK
jgi:signal transduction histidine kinase